MKYDLNILNEYIEKGLIIKQVHPTLPLSIYNYSRTCQYDKLWDDITLNCRGLVLDNEGNVIAKPFPKFFNYEEHTADEIPNELFDVYEKMDGSLGILFYYEEKLSDERRYNIWFNNNYETGMERFFDPNNLPDFDDPYYEPTPTTKGEWHMATRGSFTSEQAIKGKELLEKYNFEKLHTDYTYLFEIIYKENRIVCDYDFEDVVLLGIIHIKTGNEVNLHSDTEDIRIQNILKNIGFNVVMRYNTFGEGFDVLKKEISNSKEGYVIRFRNGMRMKIKGDEYVRLHRILTNFSTTDIWELLRTKGNMSEFLERVPDEFDDWVKRVSMDLRYSFFHINERAGKMHDYFRYGKYNDKEFEPTKKEFALHLEKSNIEPSLRSVLFAMWDGKPYDDIIWKLIKPKWSKPFKKDSDG
jgi:RNA ligase